MDAVVRVGKVHIIEWLGPKDRKTGRELLDEVEPLAIMSKPQLDVAFSRVSTRAEFVALLHAIEADFRATGIVPLLHVETHGDIEDGIGIPGGQGFTWPELMNELIPLNQSTGLRLVIVMAACWGIWGIKMAQLVDRAPFLALIGPKHPLDDHQVAAAMQAFYRTLLPERSIDLAIRAANDAVDPSHAIFGSFSAERLFADVYNGYLKQNSTEEQIAERAEKWVAMARAERGELPPEEVARIRAFGRNYILAYEERFEETWRLFFMIDLFPENAARFNLRIELQGSDASPVLARG
jgi:hypothetical protein